MTTGNFLLQEQALNNQQFSTELKNIYLHSEAET